MVIFFRGAPYKLVLVLQALKWKRCTWHTFAFHSLMEWYQSRAERPAGSDEAVSRVKRVFDHGLQQSQVQSQPEYIKTFAQWLMSALLLSL